MKDTPTPERAASDARREERLAEALRANLKRRKEQARARGAGATGAPQPDPTQAPLVSKL